MEADSTDYEMSAATCSSPLDGNCNGISISIYWKTGSKIEWLTLPTNISGFRIVTTSRSFK